MYLFIDLLKVLAAILITNSHFSNVWPISAMASGGMLGNVLFFAVSGFGLYKSGMVLNKFGEWYINRIRRIYISVWIVGIVSCLLVSKIEGIKSIFRIFIYPTEYHFVASILLLYIVFYLIMCLLERYRIKLKSFNITYAIFVFLVYVVLYDKSWNHIDVVEESFIRFLFLGAMLLGAQFKQIMQDKNNTIITEENLIRKVVVCIGCTGVYFVSKMVTSSSTLFLNIQIISWITILLALSTIFVCFGSMEKQLQRLPQKWKKLIHEVSKRTLQIYLVQYLIIYRFEFMVFPVNLIVIVTMIILAAEIVYRMDCYIQSRLMRLKG